MAPFRWPLLRSADSAPGNLRKTQDFLQNHKELAWLPLQGLAVKKKLYLLQTLGGENLLEKCWWEIFKQPERGLNFFVHVSGPKKNHDSHRRDRI